MWIIESGPKICCPRSIQATHTHACHSDYFIHFFGSWSPRPFVVASCKSRRHVSMQQQPRSNEQMSRFPTRSLRSLSAAARSISSSLWLHHAHSLVAAAEKKTSLMQRSSGFGHGVVVSKICYVQYSDWLCQGFGLCDITIDCALSCDMWLLQTNEPILATVSWKWGRRPFSGPSLKKTQSMPKKRYVRHVCQFV